jgi:hypothetical protein
MRRFALPSALLGLTCTLVAQTPQSFPLTKPDKFHCKVSYASMQQAGNKVQLKNATLEFELGVAVAADEVTFDKTNDSTLQLSGNVRMILKR